MKPNKKAELSRIEKIGDAPGSEATVLHLKDECQVIIKDMGAFGAEALFNPGGEAERLFKQVVAIDEAGDSRLGELLSMCIGPEGE
jgi:hypothetical protein